jgi:LmbE family N-acetylglucosaminyl deacetylase
MNRRDMLKVSASAIAGAAVLGPEALAKSYSDEISGNRKVLVIGGHPDDPETACGGTMAILRNKGYDVVAVYLTKGESGIKGKTHEEAAAIRTEEAINACKVLGVRPVFLNQIDGYTELDVERYEEMRDFIESEDPDIVFTHWPVDLHRDHRVCSNLVLESWKRLKYKFDLYFFETMTGGQTQLFHPTDYVDITSVADKKLDACRCHSSQGMEDVYGNWHHQMEQFRGIEFHCKRAEAFVHLRRNNNDIM